MEKLDGQDPFAAQSDVSLFEIEEPGMEELEENDGYAAAENGVFHENRPVGAAGTADGGNPIPTTKSVHGSASLPAFS